MKRNIYTYFLLFILLVITSITASGQISQGGIPYSLNDKSISNFFQNITIEKPDMQKVFLEDELSNKRGTAYRMGLNLPVNKGIYNSGTWTALPNGDKIWRLKITAKDAMAIGVYYDKFYIPKGGKLFLYDVSYRNIIGAYTSFNNSTSGYFATELIGGENIILEYNQPKFVKDSAFINISEINYAYRAVSLVNIYKNGFGSSQACEVNVNCSEGANWKPQKQGVVRIAVKLSGGTYWCTGSVMNNVKQDYKPYILTADHCGLGATPVDFSQWIFYFNYEAPSCADPSSEGSLATKSMTGAVLMAHGGNGGASGSDFKLVLLNEKIPESYNPYFMGWDIQNTASPSGVSIHHPAGDIKKISTYLTPLVHSDWNGHVIQTHWQVFWDQTTNGHGVTEGGSSGSPILNNSGKLVGTLTGGDSDCSNQTGADYYGNLNYHWDKNGNTPLDRVKDWLDPDTTGATQVNGMFYSVIDFVSDKNMVAVGNTVNFTDKSNGGPYQYQWKFDGATPDTSNDQNPANILYTTTGLFNVKMLVKTTDTSYSKIKENYIRVYDEVKFYPNPASDFVWMNLESNNYSTIKVSIYNMFGMQVRTYDIALNAEKKIFFNTSFLSSGIYVFRIEGNDMVTEKKVIIIHK